jgi:hypothetical protein
MTMEEVASEENLRRAFQTVASNKGAAGPDRQDIDEVRSSPRSLRRCLTRTMLDYF